MPFDPLVANAGRLRILTALAVEERQEFVSLRQRTQLTDGNLAAHAKRLQSAGLIDIDKQFKAGKPVTSYLLTPQGRKALETHARRLVAAISHRRLPAGANSPTIVRQTPTHSAPATHLRVDPAPPPTPPEPLHDEPGDDWID
jgi:DNA-binding MarR family transcriptional regulator